MARGKAQHSTSFMFQQYNCSNLATLHKKAQMGTFNRALLGNLNVMACATLINTHLGEEVPNLPNMDFSSSSTYIHRHIWTDFEQFMDTIGVWTDFGQL